MASGSLAPTLNKTLFFFEEKYARNALADPGFGQGGGAPEIFSEILPT